MTTNDWFHLVGLISVFALLISFVTGAVSLFLSRQINHEQEIKMREQEVKLAELQKAASNAQTEQQRVQIELGKQQERAAKAEKELLELQERLKDGFLKLE